MFLECLTRAGLRAPDSKAWSSSALNIVLDDLRRQRLLTDDLACAPVLLHPVAVDAMEAAEGAVLVEAVRKGFPAQRSHPTYYAYSQPPDPDALRRLIRLAIYANDEAGLRSIVRSTTRRSPPMKRRVCWLRCSPDTARAQLGCQSAPGDPTRPF